VWPGNRPGEILRRCAAQNDVAGRPGGSFIFSLAHPCFEGTEREYQDKGCVEVKEYLAEHCLPQPFGCLFHRPLSHYAH